MNKRFTALQSKFHKITEQLGLERTSGDHLAQPRSPNAGLPRAVSSGLWPDRFWIPPGKKTPQPLWAVCFSDQSASMWWSFFSCWDEPSCVSVCHPLPCHRDHLTSLPPCSHHLPFNVFSRLNRPSSPSHSSQDRCSRPLTTFKALCWPLSSSSISNFSTYSHVISHTAQQYLF